MPALDLDQIRMSDEELEYKVTIGIRKVNARETPKRLLALGLMLHRELQEMNMHLSQIARNKGVQASLDLIAKSLDDS